MNESTCLQPVYKYRYTRIFKFTQYNVGSRSVFNDLDVIY